jgi:PPOX class probable F420-dependent enzyme
MSERIPNNVLDLFQKPALANLATIMPDGSPQVTPVWIDFDGTHLLVNSAQGRRKVLNVEKQPKVGLDIVDPQDPWHSLSVRGQVVEITTQGADQHINKLSKKYTGQDIYPFRQPGEVRVILKIQPERVIAQ